MEHNTNKAAEKEVTQVGHTPGPWKSEKQGRRHWAILCDSSLLDDSRRTEIIAEIEDPVGYMSAEENAANAEFIVRAVNAYDELLAACRSLIEGRVNEDSGVSVHPSGRFCTVCGLNSTQKVHSSVCPVSLAESAIARAEGGTP